MQKFHKEKNKRPFPMLNDKTSNTPLKIQIRTIKLPKTSNLHNLIPRIIDIQCKKQIEAYQSKTRFLWDPIDQLS